MVRLRRIDCSGPGITRRRAGRGWIYVSPDGRRITDPAALGRIRMLVIPPAWTDVWICPWPTGHIQATGTDARGRRQYRYHDAWRQRRDAEKFDHMLRFGRAMPALRSVLNAELARDGLDRDRVLACATRLLDLGFFRIGSEGYAEENHTYGLATILKSHASVGAATVTFDYVAKSAKRRIQTIVDPEVAELIAALKRRRGGGPELLAYRDDRGRWQDIRSADINSYIKAVIGEEFSAKDFRTWNATVLAAVGLAVSEAATSVSGRKRAVSRVVSEVSGYLGNTPAVCRSSYIDPRVIDRFDAGVTISHALDELGADTPVGHLATQGAIEGAVLALLDDAPMPDVGAA